MRARQKVSMKATCPECGSPRVKLWKNEIICLDCGTVIEELFDWEEEE